MPSTPEPPRNASPRSFRSRVGGAVRRTSSVFTIARPSTPSRSSSVDSTTIAALDTTSPPPQKPDEHVPSPIAESPAREAAAQQEAAPVGPSPLARPATPEPLNPPAVFHSGVGPGGFTDEPEDMSHHNRSDTAATQDARPPAPEVPTRPVTPEPAAHPPAVFQSGVGPGGFTDEPEEFSHHGHNDESNEQASHDAAEQSQPAPAPPPAEPQPAPVPAPEASRPSTSQSTSAPAPAPQPAVVHVDESIATVTPPPPLVVADGNTSYFDQPTAPPLPKADVPSAFRETVALNSPGAPPTSADVTPRPFGFEDPFAAPPQTAPQTPPPRPQTPLPVARSRNVSLSSEAGVGTHAQWAQGNGSVAPSKASTVHFALEDPFADPPVAPAYIPEPAAPATTTSNADGAFSMPEPSHTQPIYEEPHTVHMPLPDISDVIPGRSIREMPSVASMQTSNGGAYEAETALSGAPLHNGHPRAEPMPYDTDETRPLLATAAVSSYRSTHPEAVVSPASLSSAASLHTAGWLEYVLPDAAFYYVHPTRRATADVDLRNPHALQAVAAAIDGRKAPVPPSCEVWLREVGNGAPLARSWVDHRHRAVTRDGAADANGEDRLDREFRYWAFIESHPAHTPLPPGARTEALDALTWSYTDRLLPAPRPIPPPFAQDECQELMALLRSFGSGGDTGIQPVVHTRIVARVLLRVAQWRQRYFRPDKPLPTDVGSRARIPIPARRGVIRRAIGSGIIAVLCLGIPYLFVDRVPRRDAEHGVYGAGPGAILIGGACTCLVAAVILSASVTFLSLPGLDGVARGVTLAAVLCSAGSMAAALGALFQYKADVARARACVGEGLVHPRRVVLALPLVLLAYALCTFVAAVVVYAFRGAAQDAVRARPFPAYTRWTAIGVLGGLAGVVAAAAALGR